MKHLCAGAWLGLGLGLIGCGSTKGNSAFSSGESGTAAASGQSGSASGQAGSSSGATGTGYLGGGNNNGQLGSGSGGTGSSGTAVADAGLNEVVTEGGAPAIAAVIRDFRFWDAGDPTTDPDFENPPAASLGNAGSWDDKNIVTNTLGSDGKPVYASATGTTLTTHGLAAFNKWYNDVPGTNIHVDYPLPITQSTTGLYGYDSQVDGVPYNTPGVTGNGFFPIDDGTPYATTFGDQGKPHNYSFTVEIHTVFTYMGGEYFQFRGDDDIFVYINKALVINLGGVHAAEPANVMVDSLGLTVGQQYPLDFFSAERHVTGSNVEFTTTLALKPAQPPPR